jgi:hypothetical protein
MFGSGGGVMGTSGTVFDKLLLDLMDIGSLTEVVEVLALLIDTMDPRSSLLLLAGFVSLRLKSPIFEWVGFLRIQQLSQ